MCSVLATARHDVCLVAMLRTVQCSTRSREERAASEGWQQGATASALALGARYEAQAPEWLARQRGVIGSQAEQVQFSPRR